MSTQPVLDFLHQLELPLFGGLFLAAASSSLLHQYGRVLGCSGALHTVFSGSYEPTQAALALGLTAGGTAIRIASPFLERSLTRTFFDTSLVLNVNSWNAVLFLGLSGWLVGAGSKLASGCTSGHMLCGIARGSKRSLIATIVFFPIAIFTHRCLKPVLSVLHLFPDPSPFLIRAMKPIAPLALLLLGSPYILYLLLALSLPAERLSFLRITLLGATFASGLALAGMTRPSVVLGFFDFPLPSWNPSLLGVAVAGLGVNILIYAFAVRGRVRNWTEATKKLSDTAAEAESAAEVLVEVVTRHAPLCAPRSGWRLPELSNTTIDCRLIGGSALFGIGWGLAGVCPGPAFVAFGAYPFSIGMWSWLLGFFVSDKVLDRLL
ncbi:hypothetical protein CROQUDRAFT_40160 [Cronartium quercuum f. sp. fusiforme G11]|uniref:Sulphur transport domain-containing protein n=1 Tax=Cronartium quercuum f. sp. fusiforme G11 TaxID=708437 RepID=A0A9P6NTP8_9BASI|nr:hypothetical protein CROQUDRAFT_40160 [Cronartium quercuum f. sp. fusiforme G11]